MSFNVLFKSQRTELIEKNSRFIGIGCHSQSLNEFKLQKEAVQAEFPTANHVTFAYRILEGGTIHTRFHDAGEPSGTAGKPILMHIEGQRLINTAVFVVRFFGGIKLGAGGLVRAYGNTARQLLLEADIRPYIVFREEWIALPYSEQNRLEYLAKKLEFEILDREFGSDVKALIRITEETWKGLREEWPQAWQTGN